MPGVAAAILTPHTTDSKGKYRRDPCLRGCHWTAIITNSRLPNRRTCEKINHSFLGISAKNPQLIRSLRQHNQALRVQNIRAPPNGSPSHHLCANRSQVDWNLSWLALAGKGGPLGSWFNNYCQGAKVIVARQVWHTWVSLRGSDWKGREMLSPFPALLLSKEIMLNATTHGVLVLC